VSVDTVCMTRDLLFQKIVPTELYAILNEPEVHTCMVRLMFSELFY
jgi:hypothetical protein